LGGDGGEDSAWIVHGFWDCLGRGWLGRLRFAWLLTVWKGAGVAVGVEAEVADHFVGGYGLFDPQALAQSAERGVHKAVHDSGFAVVDHALVVRARYGVDVVEDGVVVFRVDEADERHGDEGAGRRGPLAHAEQAGLVGEAEVFAVGGGHGAAGAVDAEMGAAGDGHDEVLSGKRKSPAGGWALMSSGTG